MDADLQDDPKEIMPLYKMIIDQDYDLISGWKKTRFDPITKTLPSKFFNEHMISLIKFRINQIKTSPKVNSCIRLIRIQTRRNL